MLRESFIHAVDGLFAKINSTQAGKIEKAAEMIVTTVKNGGNVHVFDSGHIINMELIGRAGGLALFKALKYTFAVEDNVHPKDQAGRNRSQEGLGLFVLRQSNLLPGDTLIMGSVSGKTALVVDIAAEAKKAGVHLITISSVEYSSKLDSEHSSGKHLYELGDVSIDNCAPAGDAMLPVEGLENKFGPASGLSAAYIMWQISALVTEKLLAAGIQPTVYRSVNFPGGPEDVAKCNKRYEELGY
jgi:uncharacterized phosphosugar-binding protein